MIEKVRQKFGSNHTIPYINCTRSIHSQNPFEASISALLEGGGRGAYIIARRDVNVTHPLHWICRRLRRVSRSSSKAQLLAETYAASILIYLQLQIYKMTYLHDATLLVDSRALMNLVTALCNPAEPVNKKIPRLSSPEAQIRAYQPDRLVSWLS